MIEVILMQRVEKLGQMGEVVKVRPGYARNFLLPQGKAIRASKDNLARFEQQRAQLEAQNLKRREEAERVAERVQGLSVTIIRSAGESGGLYGSVSARDVAEACTASGLSIARQQVLLDQPIKTVGLTAVRVELHPEVQLPVTVNVARSPEEAEKQARGAAGGPDPGRRPRPNRVPAFRGPRRSRRRPDPGGPGPGARQSEKFRDHS